MNDIIVLSLLLEGPKHGYRLKQDAAMFAEQQQLHNNTIYPLLKRFLKSGWITQQEANGERGQTRLLYALTPTGKKILVDKVADFSDADVINPHAFRLRVGLFGLLDSPTRERILRLRDDHLAARLDRIHQIAKAHIIEGWSATTMDHVLKEIQLERKWISQLMTQI
ncbi:PadR family transcriptional regulator [Edaphobacter aggregans]|jgi:DNA-binding PadR family transcriptional regulator|uniref:PadR family transcriptional regulator n=1 Tax=Edaphobacter aggregans TaxID=570835 RepID=A0A428MHW2_9BACT|nr:helix-turn-helix transcriptional regulator [Edaphobacter aggregans]RSL16480.1 PadR family transcriptional regulator [Edaphobacter aggregans]